MVEFTIHPPPSDGHDSIRDRVEDSWALREAARLEGALLMACVAFAAAARRALPDVKGDRAQFIGLLGLYRPNRLEVEYRGELRSFEDLLYTWVRCELVHVAGLPVDIGWITGPSPKDLIVRAGGPPQYRLLMSPGWIDFLLSIATTYTQPDE